MDLKLKDKVVLVTGGTGGIGTAMLAGTYAMDKRCAKPEEVANAVLYLASDVSAHTAGMGMHVDSKVSAPN